MTPSLNKELSKMGYIFQKRVKLAQTKSNNIVNCDEVLQAGEIIKGRTMIYISIQFYTRKYQKMNHPCSMLFEKLLRNNTIWEFYKLGS